MARRKKKSSFWAPQRIAARVVYGDERDHPHPFRRMRGWFTTQVVASASRNPKTGEVKSRGMRRTQDGWRLDGSRRTRTYRSGEVDPPRAARSKARSDQRKTSRAARTSRTRTAPAQDTPNTNPNLARKAKRGPGGRMAGSVSGVPKIPTPRQAVGLQRLGCDWCRGTGTRPLTTGKGRVKTVIGIAPCAHSWAVPNHGPGQDAPDRWDSLVCPLCQNAGSVTVKVEQKSGPAVAAKVPCFTCNGWIRHW